MMALINIALYWSKAKLEFLVLGWSVVVQTDFHVKPTTKLLGLGWCCLAWLQGYDNNDIQLQIVTDSYRQLQIVTDSYRQLQKVRDSYSYNNTIEKDSNVRSYNSMVKDIVEDDTMEYGTNHSNGD